MSSVLFHYISDILKHVVFIDILIVYSSHSQKIKVSRSYICCQYILFLFHVTLLLKFRDNWLHKFFQGICFIKIYFTLFLINLFCINEIYLVFVLLCKNPYLVFFSKIQCMLKKHYFFGNRRIYNEIF